MEYVGDRLFKGFKDFTSLEEIPFDPIMVQCLARSLLFKEGDYRVGEEIEFVTQTKVFESLCEIFGKNRRIGEKISCAKKLLVYILRSSPPRLFGGLQNENYCRIIIGLSHSSLVAEEFSFLELIEVAKEIHKWGWWGFDRKENEFNY